MWGVHRTCAETEAVSYGTSHETTETAATTLVDIENAGCTVTHSESHTTGVLWVCLHAENSAIVAVVKHLGSNVFTIK